MLTTGTVKYFYRVARINDLWLMTYNTNIRISGSESALALRQVAQINAKSKCFHKSFPPCWIDTNLESKENARLKLIKPDLAKAQTKFVPACVI